MVSAVMLSRALRLLVAGSFLLLAAGSGAQPVIPPEAKPILEQFFKLYQQAGAFSVNARQIRRVNGTATADASMQVLARKPNEAWIQIQAEDTAITMVSDGRQLVVHQSPPNSWVTKPGAVSFQELTRNMLTGLESLSSSDVRASVLADVLSVTMSPSEKIGGRDCWRFEFTQPGISIGCWIHKAPEPFLEKLVIRTLSGADEAIEFETTFVNWKINPQITREMFRFTPPHDAEEAVLPKEEAPKS